MKRLNKCLLVFLSVFMILSLASCSTLEITDEMQNAMDEYLSAVAKSEIKTMGKIKVESVLDDNAIEFKKTKSVIDYSFEVVDEKVKFERVDYLDDKENAKYTSDGEKVLAYDYNSLEWTDKTAENKQFLSSKNNPFVTLSLFRVDSNKKIRKEYLTDIKSYEKDGEKVIEFTLKNSAVSEVLGLHKANGIVRESTKHTRSYYINQEGYISKIVIFATQDIISNGEVGKYSSEMTVICE